MTAIPETSKTDVYTKSNQFRQRLITNTFCVYLYNDGTEFFLY